MSDAKTYAGGCHCGQVAYEVNTEIGTVMECNCSHCIRHGFLLTFVAPEQFILKKGQNHLREYRFNTRKIQHLHCDVCGIESFARGSKPDGTQVVAINVRCIENIDLGQLNRQPIDGKSL